LTVPSDQAGRTSDPRSRILTALAPAVALLMLFGWLGALPLIDPDEGRNAQVAREMLHSGSWLVPTYDGLVYLDKPAFFFRLAAASMAAFGETAFAARLPSALFAAALLVMLFTFCRRQYGERTAALAVLVVATAPLYFAFARIVIFDMTLAFFVCGAVLSGFLAETSSDDRSRRRWWALSAACAGVATLVKGPVGFIVPLLAVLAWSALDRRRGVARRLFAPVHLLIWLAIVLPWFVGVSIARPDFPNYGLIHESLARFTTGAFRRTAPFYYYVPVVALTFFPWSLLVPGAAIAAWRTRARLGSTDRLFIAWAAVVVLFFSISQSKLPGYVLTAIVALGVLVARVIDRALSNANGRAASTLRHGVVALAAVSAIGAGVLALDLATGGAVREAVRARPAETIPLLPVFRPVAISLTVIALLSIAAWMSRRVTIALAAMLLFPVSLFVADGPALVRYAEAKSARPLARALDELPPRTVVACLECFPPGLPFYLERPVTVVSETGRELTSNYVLFTLERTPTWPDVIVPLARRDEWLATRATPVYLLAKRRRRAALDSVAERWGAVVTEPVQGWYGALVEPRTPREP
jgi:4-amino-4-deoxy-L-arabinose transferase-like glycosyltransferase